MPTKKYNKIFIAIVSIIVLIVVIFGALYLTPSFRDRNIADKTYKENEDITPTLLLPIKYFDKDLVLGGTYKGTNSNGDYIYSSAIIDDGARSFPTTSISLSADYYKQEISDLPLIKKDKDIFVMEEGIGHDSFREQIKLYGDWARRFLPMDTITSVEKFDVDNDGLNETIVSTCGLWGNGCPHDVMIVKNNKIIFQTSYGIIIPSKTGNGFYLEWEKSYKDPHGYILTRFVFEDKQFKPVYEQEVFYIRVEDTMYREK
jgi:hypothetical protein